MSLGLGRQLYLQPRVARTLVGHFHKCRDGCSSQDVSRRQMMKLHSSAFSNRKKILHLSEKCSRVFTTRAALNRRGRDGGETSWDKAAESYFSDGKEAIGKEGAGDYGSRTRVEISERGGDSEGRTRIASYKTKGDDWQSKKQISSSQRGGEWADESLEFEGGGVLQGRRKEAPLNLQENDWQSRNQLSYRQARRERGDDGVSSSRGRSSTGDRWGGEGARREIPSTSSRTFRDGSSSSSRRPISFRDRTSGRNAGFDSGTGAREQQWQRSQGRSLSKDDDFRSTGVNKSKTRGVETVSRGGYGRVGRPSEDNRWGGGADRPQEERYGEGEDWRWRAREPSPPLEMEGQAVYGVAPVVNALQASRRTFYTLYMQENLAQNVMSGKRKDKHAVTWIQRKARSLGVTVKEASKHDLNMLVDNRPHQGLVLDASPLELVPIDTLEAPVYDGDRAPVWVALDEITDPQNFGAVLRSAYFLGAEGVVVCAKNSAPLSGVVSKASAGALEVMDVQYCRSMVKFLDRSREKGWRILGGASEASSVPVREVPRGVATILVLGNEGRGMRTMVKRSCDELVSIVGNSNHVPNKRDYAYDSHSDDDEEIEDEEDDFEPGIRRGAELDLSSGPLAIESLNVSVAAGILLHELIIPNQQTAIVQ